MRASLICVILTLGAPAWAADSAAKPGSVTITKQQKIRELLRVTGADQVGDNMLAQMKQQLPPEQYEKLAQVIHPGEVVDLLVPIYAKHFDDADIEALLAFYRSPAGQKLVTEMPAIGVESATAGQNYARDQVKKLRPDSRSDVPAAQH